MFGKKALKEELEYVRKHNLRLESEKWELERENAQLERDKNNLEENIYANEGTISEFKKENKLLEKENKLLVETVNKKFTKDELIEQLASVIMDEGKDIQKENLVQQITSMFTVSEKHSHDEVVEQ